MALVMDFFRDSDWLERIEEGKYLDEDGLGFKRGA